MTVNNPVGFDAADCRILLSELANLDDNVAHIEQVRALVPVACSSADSDEERALLLMWRDTLRRLWVVDEKARGWGVGQVINVKVRGVANPESHWPFADTPEFRLPSPSPIETILSYLTAKRVNPSVCANPQCSAPFYFKTRKGATCGSRECKNWQISQSAKLYWNTKGAPRRREKKERSKKPPWYKRQFSNSPHFKPR